MKIYDWGYLFTKGFNPLLKKLKAHIEEHQMFVGWEEAVQEIEGALDLWDIFQDTPWKTIEAEDNAYDAFMDYLKTYMRNWWC